MKKISMICLAAGLACAATAVAKPPLQLAEKGIFVQPQRIAPAKIVNGKTVIGEWQDYSGVSSRASKAMYYAFDCYEGYASGEYPNKANGGQGATPGDTRVPNDYTCGLGTSRWFFGSTFVAPLAVEDVQTNGCFDQGGNAVDSLDFAWWWGGGTCVVAFFTSDDDASCSISDPYANTYYSGVLVSFGPLGTGGYYYTNVDGLNSVGGIFVQQPAPGGSYLIALTFDGSTLNTSAGTQMMLWGTGDANSTAFRAGTQNADAWWDINPPDGLFSGECYTFDYTGVICPSIIGQMVGMASLRCPGDVNNDGFVNGDDYDAFASAFDVADLCADFNGDGFVNGDDYDAFASNFDAGC
ncbi:MAG: hypothetical protein U0638_00710 [Phycisphaerales bacterium]